MTTTHHIRLASGTDLLGRYESPGVRHDQHLLRRGDGQILQLPPLLYAVAASLEESADLDAIARRASDISGRDLSPANVAYLIDNKLRPAGLIATDDEPPPLPHSAPLLGLRCRVGLVPERVHGAVTTALRPLFRAGVVVITLGLLVALDGWMIANHGDVVDAGRQLLYHPQLVLLVTGLTIASAVFHETGHATAARYGGATPGVMGAGVYLIWPVFYTDVTDSYRLDRRGRLRTDLGGVYFNVLFTLATAAVYFVTGFQPLLVFLVVAQLETLQQFLPFVRLDGYYVVSDLIGVANLFSYMRPALVLLTRQGSETDRRVAHAKLANLKPWARRTVRAWVFLTAPILLVNLVLILVFAPAIAGAAWGSVQVQANQAAAAYGDGRIFAMINAVFGIMLLLAPIVGTLYVAGMATSRIARATRRWHRARPILVTAGALAVAGALTMQIGIVWPSTFESALEHSRLEQPAARGVAPPAPSATSPAVVAPDEPPAAPLATGGAAPAPAALQQTPPAPPPAAASIPPPACGGRPHDDGGRRAWMEQVLCEAAA